MYLSTSNCTQFYTFSKSATSLFATEQWLSLIDHQIKVTKHNLKILLQQHVPITRHFGHMEITAAKQAIDRQQSPSKKDTPRKARHRAIQSANKAMRARLYAKKQRPRQARLHPTRRCPSRHSVSHESHESTGHPYLAITHHDPYGLISLTGPLVGM